MLIEEPRHNSVNSKCCWGDCWGNIEAPHNSVTGSANGPVHGDLAPQAERDLEAITFHIARNADIPS